MARRDWLLATFGIIAVSGVEAFCEGCLTYIDQRRIEEPVLAREGFPWLCSDGVEHSTDVKPIAALSTHTESVWLTQLCHISFGG